MKTYRLHNTDLDVSRLAFGTWHLGGSWDKTPADERIKQRALALIETAVSHHINLIDLADIYTWGKSDEMVGHALRQNPSLRDQLVLQAKCGIIMGNDPNPGDPGRYDFSFDHIVSAVEGTLRRLGTDRVEILLLHRPDPLMEPEEVARAFDHLQQSGKVRYFGVSNFNAGQIALLQHTLDQPLLINQVELNLLHHHLISDGIVSNMTQPTYPGISGTLDYCRLHHILIQAWSPVAGGQLFAPRADAPPHVHAAAAEIARLAAAHNTSKEAIALAWLLRHPAPIQPILGTLKPERIAPSVLADEVELSRIEWYQLLAAARGAGVP
ncbi:MAG: aldo/keto reductase [Anaerolineaceae bacterium]|nr:aldo/keto reductase [Anaerolineaceae bacterium]